MVQAIVGVASAVGLMGRHGACSRSLVIARQLLPWVRWSLDPPSLVGCLPCSHMLADQRISPAMRLTEPPHDDHPEQVRHEGKIAMIRLRAARLTGHQTRYPNIRLAMA